MAKSERGAPRPSSLDAERAQERSNTVTVIVQLLNEEWDINVASWLLERLDHLARHSPTTADETSALKYAGTIFTYVAEHAPDRAYTREERLLVRIGTLFSDVGKTGPPGATPEQQELLVRIFGVENVPDRDSVTLSAFFAREKQMRNPWISNWTYRFVPRRWQRYLRKTMHALGIDPETTTLRDVHDMHSTWTLHLLQLEDSGIPKRAIPAAAAHHRVRGDNPGDILDEDDSYLQDFGTNTGYTRAEKLVSALDLYDAYRRRGQLGHDEAVAALRQEIAKSAYAEGETFSEIIGDIDTALAEKQEGT